MLTVAPLAKLVPVSVIVVPPAVEPDEGVTLPIVGGGSATYVKAEASVLDRPSTVTVTSAAPAARAAVVAWIVVLLTNFTLVAGAPPTVTVAPSAKLAPLMVTRGAAGRRARRRRDAEDGGTHPHGGTCRPARGLGAPAGRQRQTSQHEAGQCTAKRHSRAGAPSHEAHITYR